MKLAQQPKGLAWLVLTVFLAFVFAEGLPYFAKFIPWRAERWASVLVGNPDDLHVCLGSRNPEAAALLDRITRRLYPIYPTDKFPLTIQVVSGEPVNAFASLNGRIYVYTGLLQQADSAEELAGVLAHEIEHVRRRHIMEGLVARLITLGSLKLIFSGGKHGTWPADLLLSMSFSRKQEQEADESGLQRLRDARIDVSGFARFFERAENMSAFPAILSDHPSSGTRAQLARRYAGHPFDPLMDQKDWKLLKTICQ